MKKILLGLGLFLSTILFIGVDKGEAATLQVNERIDVYDTIDNVKTKVGILLENQGFKITTTNTSYYYIPFGNGTAYHGVTSPKVSTNDNSLVNPSKSANSNTVVIPTTQINVYSEASTTSTVIAKINQGVRYPIVSKVNTNWYKINIGGRTGYIRTSQVKSDVGIPVLTYHHIVDNPNLHFANNSAVISTSAFNQQMKYLNDNGWKTITINNLDRYLQKKTNLTEKVAIITFDDGNVSTINKAYPTLKSYGFKATSFVIGNRINTEAPPLDESKLQFVGLKEMNESSDVFQYQHHTNAMHTTQDGKPLMLVYGHTAIVNDTKLCQESIARINAYNGDTNKVKYMAYPFGATSEASRNALLDAGITLGFTTVNGMVNLGDARMTLNRQIIVPSDTMTTFKGKLGQ